MKSRNEERQYFGLVINQIEGRYQHQIISGLTQWTKSQDIGLMIISGRSFNSPYPEEQAYNSIYQIIREAPLSGLIVAAGSLGSFQGEEETAAFFRELTDKPLVTLGMELPGHPCIKTDNSNGIQEAVHHAIETHGYERIAFVCGPDSNEEAVDRFTAFTESMHAAGREIDPELIYQGDLSYRCTASLAADMVSTGKLQFDVLLCANDEMAIGIFQNLQRLGFSAPRDYAIIGFDNLDEARFLSPPLTTVCQFLHQQAAQAGEYLQRILKGDTPPDLTTIKSSLIIRESCGCDSAPLFKMNTEQTKPAALARSIQDQVLQIIHPPVALAGEITGIVFTLLQTLDLDVRIRREHPLFLQILHESLELTFSWTTFGEMWHKILSAIQQVVLSELKYDYSEQAYLGNLFGCSYAVVTARVSQREAQRYTRFEAVLTGLRDLNEQLNSVLTRNQIWDILADRLPALGIRHALVSRHVDGVRNEPEFGMICPVLYLNNTRENLVSDPYPAVQVFPSDIKPMDIGHTLIILPLLKHDKHFGMVILEATELDLLVYDTIANEISQALFVSDVFSEREQSTRSLEQSMKSLVSTEQRTRSVIDQLPLGIIETTPHLTIRRLNSTAENILGRDSRICGSSLTELFDGDRRGLSDQERGELSHTGSLDIPNMRITRKGSMSMSPVLRISVAERDTAGLPTLLVWSILDTTLPLTKQALPDDEFYRTFQLTKREQEILSALLSGRRIRDIAGIMFIAESTVKGHVSQIYSKLQVSGKTEMLSVIRNYKQQELGYDSYLLSVINSLLSRNTDPSKIKPVS
ncbi:substrate-binding domain-containing protein [Spirochaeta dissipatitropha]